MGLGVGSHGSQLLAARTAQLQADLDGGARTRSHNLCAGRAAATHPLPPRRPTSSRPAAEAARAHVSSRASTALDAALGARRLPARPAAPRAGAHASRLASPPSCWRASLAGPWLFHHCRRGHNLPKHAKAESEP